MTFRLTLTTIAALTLATSAYAEQGKPGAHFIENWDLDGDGQVTLSEAQEKRGDIFFMFDGDENGLLESSEYDLFDETRRADMDANAGGAKKGPMRGVEKAMMREFNDVNGDGKVSKDEFVTRAADWFKMMDRNGDGVVTTDDFMKMGG